MELKNVDKLPIDIKEAIKKRISTRTYEEKSLTKVDKNKLMDFNRTREFDTCNRRFTIQRLEKP